MSDDLGFSPPPFKPDEALQTLKRELRGLGLTEREGRFERRGMAIARAAIEGNSIRAARVRKPPRSSPEWQDKLLTSSAQAREFVADLKRQLTLWNDLDD